MKTGNTRRANLTNSGQSLLEATFGVVIIAIVVIGLVDVTIVLYGVSLNDTACRNAARAAAAGDPAQAQGRAQLTIDQLKQNTSDGMISQPKLVLPIEVVLTDEPIPRHDPETGKPFSPGGMVTGNVTVKTQVDIRPFAMDIILRRKEPLTFWSKQTFPVHYVEPPS
jgi:Flp pilus assembly protein TadG